MLNKHFQMMMKAMQISSSLEESNNSNFSQMGKTVCA